MASIHGFGNIGPIPGGSQPRPSIAPKQAEVDPQVGQDGLSINFERQPEVAPRSTASPAETVAPREAAPAPAAPAPSAPAPSRVPTTLSMEGAFGISSIGLSSGDNKISSETFTNGLGSTQLVSLNGKVLADLNPVALGGNAS